MHLCGILYFLLLPSIPFFFTERKKSGIDNLMEWITMLLCLGVMCCLVGGGGGVPEGIILWKFCLMFVCVCFVIYINLCQDWFCRFQRICHLMIFVWIATRQTEHCFQPWCNLCGWLGSKYQLTAHQFHSLGQNQSTVAQWADTTVECSWMSYVWAHFPDRFPHCAWTTVSLLQLLWVKGEHTNSGSIVATVTLLLVFATTVWYLCAFHTTRC